ncbi:MAG: GNAT family N-acetyltransferase [Chloroflexi bacterium]|nr:GNAT family N-acetyltransferase [Chloroflexota bacterium]NOG66431.1 GNAT family N-acetyltransferase [Chloroflexota bacterium]
MTIDTMTLTLRQPLPEEAEAVFALITHCERTDLGEALLEWEEQLDDWAHNPPENRWVVATADQQIAGYAILMEYGPGDNAMYAYVHPDFTGLGIGTMLIQAAERRVNELAPATGAVYFRAYNPGDKPAADELFTENGFHILTHAFLMQIELSAPPPAPVWPDDLKLRMLRMSDEKRAVYEVVEEAFAQPGRVRRDFDQWCERVFENVGFDPTMFYVVENPAGEIVAAVHCQCFHEDTMVSQLVVREDYRRRGIALNMLYTIYGVVWLRGRRSVVLSVDGQNPTNAISVYQRAGMSVKHHFVKWEKVIREG